MAIKVKVVNNRQIIVPLRFVRAVTGPTQADAPDVDDRGFAMGTRPGTWGSTDTRGAMVSMAAGDVVRVNVSREDLDATAHLFVTSSDTSVATIDTPQDALAAKGDFSVKGIKDVISVPVKLQIHLGSLTGPVVGEIEPHIFQLRQLRVVAHLVSINGVSTARTADTLTQLFQGVNDIWRAVGIEFLYNSSETLTETVTGFRTAGTVTTNLSSSPPDFAEFSQVINQHPSANAVNVYLVQASVGGWDGLTFDNEVARPTGYGVVVVDKNPNQSDAYDALVLAHELGHYLDLDVHADEGAGGKKIRDDIWSRRRLMYAGQMSQGPDYDHDIGYGDLQSGCLIDVKDLSGDPNDGSTARNRRRSLNPF